MGPDMTATSTFIFGKAHAPGLVRPALVAGTLIVLATGLSGCKSESAPYTAAPQPVRAASVTFSAATDTRSYTGTIDPRYDSDLGFRASGKLAERLVNIADGGTPGMTAARLNSPDYRPSL